MAAQVTYRCTPAQMRGQLGLATHPDELWPLDQHGGVMDGRSGEERSPVMEMSVWMFRSSVLVIGLLDTKLR